MTTKICKKCEIEKLVSEFSKHSDTKDKLDHRCKACVRLVKQNSERTLKPRELDVVDTDVNYRDWQGGKKKGTIINRGNGLFIASVANKKSKSFRMENYDNDETRLRTAATEFLYKTSLEMNLTTNRYKIIFHKETDEPQYLLVQLSKDFVMLCDYDQLDLVKNHHLFVTISGNTNEHRSHYAAFLQDSKNKPFHKGITGFEMTDHINRYPMDNRRCNLRETNALENNRNKTNHYQIEEYIVEKGLDFDTEHEVWNACVNIDGDIKIKSFPIAQTNYQEAKEKAHYWCQQTIEKYKKNPITGVVFDRLQNVFRSRIKIQNKDHEQRFHVSKYGYDVARQMAIDWRTEMAKQTDNYVSRPDEVATNRHHDFDRLKSEFEDIMIQHATGMKWKL